MDVRPIQLSILSLIFFGAGCAGLQDAIVRSIHMDHSYRRRIFPSLYEKYQLKMEQRELHRPLPIVVPDSADQG